MPGMYAEGDYDLAGFCVGAVNRDGVLTGDSIAPDDVILGLASSGVHSNGFSLVRRIIDRNGWDLDKPIPSAGNKTLGALLLEPTKIYVRALLPLAQEGRIKGLAHITGGGLLENIPRVLPDGCHAVIDAARWEMPPIFAILQEAGGIAPEEMARTFNCGVGMVVIVAGEQASAVSPSLEGAGETVVEIGRIEQGSRGCTVTNGSWSATHNA
jgi:phosphoribosylformylglycinamidine cyclo-ligase